MRAFEILDKINKLEQNSDKCREWLKQYEGKCFSIGIKEKDLISWKKDEDKYVYYDSRWNETIKTIKGDEVGIYELNKIQRHDRIFVIEFDDKLEGTDIKDKKKIEENLSKVKALLEKFEVGYIESTHKGNSNYIWIEYSRDLNDKELESVIKILSPIGSEVDTNFSSSNRRLPVLFAKHWKYETRELPVHFFEGNKLSDDLISKIALEKNPVKTEDKNINGYKTSVSVEISKEVLDRFKQPNLLEQIKEEISRDHLEDDNVKMTAFLVSVSGLLRNPNKRMSLALTGDSSVGKDSVMKNVLKHMPEGSYLFLTNGTQPAIEDEAMFARILALSEMNLFRETGANKNLLEVVKQRTEGGTSAIKKDASTAFRTTKHERTEQGSVLYGTTDAERNDETETRFIFGSVEAKEKKITKVNQNTTDKVSDINKLLSSSVEKNSWIKEGLSKIVKEFENSEVLIPYAEVMMQKVKRDDKEISIIDHTSPRSMRDLKRLYALVSATTFMHAFQRKIIEKDGIKIIVSEPEDLINTLKYSQEFFNETYTGMDSRLNDVLLEIDAGLGSWIARDAIQRKLQVTLNTIKSWIETLEAEGLIEEIRGSDLNARAEEIKKYDGNKIYLKRCQKGVKKMLIRCEEKELKKLLENKSIFKGINFFNGIDTILSDFKEDVKVSISQIDEHGPNTQQKNNENSEILSQNSEIDTFELTPLHFSNKVEEIKWKKQHRKLGWSEEEIEDALK